MPPVQSEDRDEDSGLHDIRSLASSARMRISSRRISTTPPVDEDVLASSSAGWKAVALPEPAKMVSLPELSELPPAKELKQSRKSRRSMAAAPAEGTTPPPVAAAVAQPPLHLDAPASATPSVSSASSASISAATPMIGARIAASRSGSKRNLMLGLVGVGLAAAAGAVIFVTTQGGAQDAGREPAPAPAPAAAQPAPRVQAIATDDQTKAAAPVAATEAAEPPPAVEPAPADVPEPPPAPAKAVHAKKAERKPAKKIIEVKGPTPAVKEAPKPEPTKTDKPAEGQPDFNELLREAGVDPNKPAKKPKLERTELGVSDFRKGMSAVAGQAKGCYNGTQGIAKIALTVAPSGKVTKVAVSGVFAGTPVAACVEAAVKGATFPPWDGGPQSLHYTYLLSE